MTRFRAKKPVKVVRRGRPPKVRWYRIPNKHPKEKPRPCACGCEGMTKTGFFLRGHIHRLREKWRKHIKFGEPLEGIALGMLEELKLNPNRAMSVIARDYWRKNGE